MAGSNDYAIVSKIWPLVAVVIPAIVICIVAFTIYWCCPCCRLADRQRRLERHPPESESWVPVVHRPKGWKTEYDAESQYQNYNDVNLNTNHPFPQRPEMAARF